MNIFFGLPPEGMTVFLGFGPDGLLFSQKELPQGSGRVWFVTSEALPLEICQASAFERYTLPFNGNLLPEHTLSFREGVLLLENFCSTGTQLLCLSSHRAVGCIGSATHVAHACMPLALQNLCILLLAYGVALNLRVSELIWAQPVWSCWSSQASKPLHSTLSVSPGFPCAWHDDSIKPRFSVCCLVFRWLRFT